MSDRAQQEVLSNGQTYGWALLVLCLSNLMISADANIVTVALPTIRTDLGFSGNTLAWVVNAYTLTFAGFRLLGGRLGDLLGHRRMFLFGIALFTVASMACGLATSRETLTAARAIQGVAAAVVSAVMLPLIMILFAEPRERTHAMGISSFVSGVGSTVAMLLGGALTTALSWQWVFLINIPVGIGALLIGLPSLPRDVRPTAPGTPGVAAAVTLTSALLVLQYAIADTDSASSIPTRRMTLIAVSVVLLALYVLIEARATVRLVPHRLLRKRNLITASIAQLLFSAALSTWWFVCSGYLQLVRGYDALHVGLAFLPASQSAAVFALGFSSRVIGRYGIKAPWVLGLLICALGLALFSRAPNSGTFVLDVLPCMILVGLGAGMCSAPAVLAAMEGVSSGELGIASGTYGTVIMTGSTLGVGVLAACADEHSSHLLANGSSHIEALNGGYHLAFLWGAVLLAIAAGITAAFLHIPAKQASS